MEIAVEVDEVRSSGKDLSVCGASIDLAQYVCRFSGMTKVRRLLHIADNFSNYQVEAYRLLIEELKRGINTGTYQDVFQKLNNYPDILAQLEPFDEGWINSANKEKRRRQDVAETELSTAKSSSNKEGIRRGHMNMGNLLLDRGELIEANTSFMRSRDYFAKTEHQVEMCLKVGISLIDLGNISQAQSYIFKVDVGENKKLKSKISALAGLLYLLEGGEGGYKNAARSFLEIDGSVIDIEGLSNVIAAEDIALYGCICALATYNFVELRTAVLENKAFKSLLELAPRARLMVQQFCDTDYGGCLQYLELRAEDARLDIYLCNHIHNLYSMISDRVLIQCFKPYDTLDLTRMAETLGKSSVGVLEGELATLIAKNQIPARIDSEAHTLHRKVTNEREISLAKVMELGDTHTTCVRQGILRLSLMEHRFAVETSDWEERD